MIDYDAVNSFIGKRWVYIENDCWTVFCDASLAVFDRAVKTVKIPAVSCIKKNTELFDNYFNADNWPIVNKPIGGDAVLFRSRKGHILHIGLYIEKGNVLHCIGSAATEGQTMYEPLSSILTRYQSAEFRRCK